MADLHPLIVHFPIALFMTGFVVDIVGNLWKKGWLSDAGMLMVCVGTVAGLGALVSGNQAEEVVEGVLTGFGESVMERHEELADLTVPLLLITASLRIVSRFRSRMPKAAFTVIIASYFLLGSFSLIALGVTAHAGGQIVYDGRAGFQGSSSLYNKGGAGGGGEGGWFNPGLGGDDDD